MNQAKRNTLLLLSVFGVLIIIMAMSLPTLVLAPGQPFALDQSQQPALGNSGGLSDAEIAILMVRGFLGIALVLFPLYLVLSLLTGQGRRRLILDIVLIIVLFSLANYLHLRIQNNPLLAQLFGIGQNKNQAADSVAASVFSPTPPQGLTLIIVLIASIAIAVFIAAALWLLRPRPQPPETALEILAREAQTAIESIQTGDSLKATVIHCYQEMSRAVQVEKGLARESAMTPHEFETQLIGKGLPEAPIKTLTALFERVRYGNTPADAEEENLAVSCLTNIVAACRTGGRWRES